MRRKRKRPSLGRRCRTVAIIKINNCSISSSTTKTYFLFSTVIVCWTHSAFVFCPTSTLFTIGATFQQAIFFVIFPVLPLQSVFNHSPLLHHQPQKHCCSKTVIKWPAVCFTQKYCQPQSALYHLSINGHCFRVRKQQNWVICTSHNPHHLHYLLHRCHLLLSTALLSPLSTCCLCQTSRLYCSSILCSVQPIITTTTQTITTLHFTMS